MTQSNADACSYTGSISNEVVGIGGGKKHGRFFVGVVAVPGSFYARTRAGLGSEQPEGSGPEATLSPTFSGGSLQFGSINAFSCRHASQSETGGRAGYSAHLQHPS